MSDIPASVPFDSAEALLAEFARRPDHAGHVHATRLVTVHPDGPIRQVRVVATALAGGAILRFEMPCGHLDDSPGDGLVHALARLKIRHIQALGRRLGVGVRAGLWEHARPA